MGKDKDPCFGKENFCFKIGVLENNLTVLSMNVLPIHVNIWVIEEYVVKVSWTKICTIKCLSDLVTNFLYPSFYISYKGDTFLFYGAPGVRQNH